MKPVGKELEGGQVVKDTAGLAAYLGISRWTVSRVLNGQPGVKEETRERVQAAVKELGFEPNRMARGLRGGQSKMIGVSFQHLEAIILAKKSAALQRYLVEQGYRGIYEMPGQDTALEEEVIRHFLSIQVDGIVLIGSILEEESPVFDLVASRNVGMVLVDPRHDLNRPSVSLNRELAMAEIYEHLHDLGHRHIDLFGFGTDDMYRQVRLRGLERASNQLDGKAEIRQWDLDGFSHQDYRYGEALALSLLGSGQSLPTAIICLSDRIALGAMKRFQDEGLKVPEDISLVGFDNLPETNWTRPRLTTYDQNIEDIMKKSTAVLINSLEGGKKQQVHVRGRMVIRESTGTPRV